MFTKPPHDHKLDREISNVYAQLQILTTHDKEYAAVLDRLVVLKGLKEKETPKPINPETLITAAANLIGIVLILRYERIDIVTSKALSFVPKLR